MLARSLIKTPNDAITNEKPEANRTSEIKIIGKKIIEKFKSLSIIMNKNNINILIINWNNETRTVDIGSNSRGNETFFTRLL
tara:strand:- start:254 stop:499 length:246 start_codon:yes stop_codon:yes gene_type:complete